MGFVKLPDDLAVWEWFDDKNTVYVFLRLLLGAAWCEKDFRGVHLERGQLIISQREFAEKCGISRQELRTIINRLISTPRITLTSTPKFSVVTVLDYDCSTHRATHKATANQPTINPPSLYNNTDIQNTDIQNSKKVKCNDIENNFKTFWDCYPKKVAKQTAHKSWLKINSDKVLFDEIISSLERQKLSAQWQKDNGQYIPNPATWLNGKRWEDEVKTDIKTNSNNKSDEPDYSVSFSDLLKNS